MAYRTRNWGISLEEFLAHKEEFGKKISAKKTHEAFVDTKEQELYQWSQYATEEYTEFLSEEDQENLYNEGGLFIVPFSTNAEAFIHYLDGEGFIDDEDELIGKTKAFPYSPRCPPINFNKKYSPGSS